MTSKTLKQSQLEYTQKAAQHDPDSEYITPKLFELQKLLWRGAGAASTHADQAWPGVYIRDEKTALERHSLEEMGITHVLCAAEGKRDNAVTTARAFLTAERRQKTTSLNHARLFYPAARFIDHALSNPESKLLAHCIMGRVGLFHADAINAAFYPTEDF